MSMFAIIARADMREDLQKELSRLTYQYIALKAESEGVNVSKALNVAKCESGFKPWAIGDGGNSYGVFQVHLPSHPYFTRSELLNPVTNIDWAISQMKLGKWGMWSCYRKIYT